MPHVSHVLLLLPAGNGVHLAASGVASRDTLRLTVSRVLTDFNLHVPCRVFSLSCLTRFALLQDASKPSRHGSRGYRRELEAQCEFIRRCGWRGERDDGGGFGGGRKAFFKASTLLGGALSTGCSEEPTAFVGGALKGRPAELTAPGGGPLMVMTG